MESRPAKISDPNYVRLAVSGFDQFWAEQKEAGKLSFHSQAPSSETGTTDATNAVSGGIDAADLLGYFYAEVHNAACDDVQHASPLPSESSPPDDPSEAQPGGHCHLSDKMRNDYSSSDSPGCALQGDVTLTEASEILGLDRRSILGLVTIGQLAADTDSRGQLMISGSSLQAFRGSAEAVGPTAIPKPEPGTATFHVSPPTASSFDPEPESRTAEEPQTDSSPDKLDAPARVDVYELVSKLSEAQSQLESASYRIGFLEAELTASEQKIRLIPDFQSQENRLVALERENYDLKIRLEKLEKGPFGLLTQLFSLLTRESPHRQLRQPPRSQGGQEPDQYYYRRSRKEFY